MPAFLSRCAIAACVGSMLSVSAARANLLQDYNLIVFENATSTSNVFGRTLIGGNLGGPASDYGLRLLPASNFGTTDVLTVGGNITTNNINIAAGDLRRAGTRSGNVNFNGPGGNEIIDNSGSIASTVASVRAQLESASLLMIARAATNTVNFPSGQPAGVVFNCVPASDGAAIFNFAASSLFGNSNVQQIDINLNGATSVVMNVTGLTIGWSMGNFVGNFVNPNVYSRVIWNFADAANINWLNGGSLRGSLLAPGARLEFASVIEGSVAVRELDQRSEVHLPGYTGLIPSPGTAALMALAGILASRRRR